MDALRIGKLSSSGIRLLAASITCRLPHTLLFENNYYYCYHYVGTELMINFYGN